MDSLKKVSRKTKLSLRNHLTKRYPALPLPPPANTDEEKNDQNDEELEMMDLGERVDTLGQTTVRLYSILSIVTAADRKMDRKFL